mmetsp:Transcript_76057/g.152808  ORF Transcript_76057/g.152808 Transcript_76057/m.152808 type:complete len:216 (-) Transcript_76057:36-683(-)
MHHASTRTVHIAPRVGVPGITATSSFLWTFREAAPINGSSMGLRLPYSTKRSTVSAPCLAVTALRHSHVMNANARRSPSSLFGASFACKPRHTNSATSCGLKSTDGNRGSESAASSSAVERPVPPSVAVEENTSVRRLQNLIARLGNATAAVRSSKESAEDRMTNTRPVGLLSVCLSPETCLPACRPICLCIYLIYLCCFPLTHSILLLSIHLAS